MQTPFRWVVPPLIGLALLALAAMPIGRASGEPHWPTLDSGPLATRCAETTLREATDAVPFASVRLNCAAWKRVVGDATQPVAKARCTEAQYNEAAIEGATAPTSAPPAPAWSSHTKDYAERRVLIEIGANAAPGQHGVQRVTKPGLRQASQTARLAHPGRDGRDAPPRYLECELPSSRQLFS
jgi:hypothetical protein